MQNAHRVVVIGAGIAGLAGAFRLQRAGVNVLVLEAADRPGGRMSTDTVDGYLIERGTQAIASTYPTIMSLVKEVGLEGDLRPLSPWGAVVRGGKPRRMKTGNPLIFFLTGLGLMGLRSWLRVGWHTGRVGSRPTDNYSAWGDLDDDDAARWCNAHFGATATAYLVEPFLDGLLYQPPEGTSRAVLLALLALSNGGRSKAMTLTRGLGSLPQALAAHLDVRFKAPVDALRVDGQGVEVRAAGETVSADQVILATTASVARTLYRQADDLEQRLMATPYASTLKVSVVTDRHWRDDERLKGVCGLFIPRVERKVIASMTVESWRDPSRVPSGEVLHALLSGEAAVSLSDRSDDEIEAAVLPEVERYFPGVTEAKRFVHIVRWQEAEPMSPVGRSRSIAEYRRRGGARRVWLAGDYMGMPWSDGAAEAGVWAADQVLASLK